MADEIIRLKLPQVSTTTTDSKPASPRVLLKGSPDLSHTAEPSETPLTVVRYAVDMLEALEPVQASSWEISNAVAESKVLHARELCDVVLSKRGPKGKDGDKDDILLKHLVPEDEWTEELNRLVKELRTKYGTRNDNEKPCWLFNKMMFHPTTKRSDSFDYTKALAIVQPLLDKIIREIEGITKRPIASRRM
jgi:hypothetical protein